MDLDGGAAQDGGDESPAAAAARRVARNLARALWHVDWQAANPEGSAEERRAAWGAIPKGERLERVKRARRALKLLARRGVTFVASANADDADDDTEF